MKVAILRSKFIMKFHGVLFIAAPSTATILQSNPVSAGTSRVNCGVHDINENNEVYKKICCVFFLFISDVNKSFTLNF
jgi:hypothetical protein